MPIIRRDRYKRGDWNAISDQDGQKRKASDMRMQWDGLWVGRDEFDPKHPQLELRARPDNPARSPVRNAEPGNLVITPPYNPGIQTPVTDVLDSDLNEFEVTNTVLNSDGEEFQVAVTVLASDLESFVIFVAPASSDLV